MGASGRDGPRNRQGSPVLAHHLELQGQQARPAYCGSLSHKLALCSGSEITPLSPAMELKQQPLEQGEGPDPVCKTHPGSRAASPVPAPEVTAIHTAGDKRAQPSCSRAPTQGSHLLGLQAAPFSKLKPVGRALMSPQGISGPRGVWRNSPNYQAVSDLF